MDLPRILCLHGGGTSASVFRLQCRSIIRHLPQFRLVFLDGPFPSRAHDAIVPFFGSEGPYYRWLRWNDDEPHDAAAAVTILSSLRRGMAADEGTGEWVGVLGFSQGAKIAASLLWAQEGIPGWGFTRFRFGVIMAGRAPVVVLDDGTRVRHTADLGQTSLQFTDWAPSNEGEHVIGTPTLHVHGLNDPGLDLHRCLLRDYCRTGTARLVEWDGDHRLPIKAADVEKVVVQLLAMAEEVGVNTHT